MNARLSARPWLVALVFLALLPSCLAVQPPVISSYPHSEPRKVRLTLRDDSEVLLHRVLITQDSVFGQRLSRGQSAEVRLPRSEIHLVEVYEVNRSVTLLSLAGGGVLAGAAYVYWLLRTVEF